MSLLIKCKPCAHQTYASSFLSISHLILQKWFLYLNTIGDGDALLVANKQEGLPIASQSTSFPYFNTLSNLFTSSISSIFSLPQVEVLGGGWVSEGYCVLYPVFLISSGSSLHHSLQQDSEAGSKDISNTRRQAFIPRSYIVW